MAFDWISFTKDFGIVLGLFSLSLMFNAWWLKRAIDAANTRINEAADTIKAVNAALVKREQRCEQCEAKYDHVLERFSDRCDVSNCPELESIRAELRNLCKEFELQRKVLRVVTDEFSNMSSRLLAIITRGLGLSTRASRGEGPTRENEEPDSGEWFIPRRNRD